MGTDKLQQKFREIVERFESYPAVQEFQAARAAENLKIRNKTVGEIEVLKKQREEVIPRLESGIEAKELAYQQAKAALDAANGELAKARGALFSERQSFNNEIAQAEGVLIATADPILDITIQWFRDSYEAVLGKLPNNQTRVGETNVHTMEKKLTIFSNSAAIQRRLAYDLAAINELLAMKLKAVPNMGRIEELKNNVPSIDEMEGYSGTRDLPGKKGINPRHLLPSDSEMDWKFTKLMKEAEKILGK